MTRSGSVHSSNVFWWTIKIYFYYYFVQRENRRLNHSFFCFQENIYILRNDRSKLLPRKDPLLESHAQFNCDRSQSRRSSTNRVATDVEILESSSFQVKRCAIELFIISVAIVDRLQRFIAREQGARATRSLQLFSHPLVVAFKRPPPGGRGRKRPFKARYPTE